MTILWADANETVELPETFTEGSPTDPPMVTLTVTDPDGVQSAHTSRVDQGCGVVTSSNTVTDSGAVLGDLGKFVTGPGVIPAGTTITAVTPGTGYTLSAAATATAPSQILCVGDGGLTRIGRGMFTFTLTCSLAGIWSYAWSSPGPAGGVYPGSVIVTAVPAGRWYTTLEELKSRLKINDDNDDDMLLVAVAAASSAIEKYTGRYFYRQTATQVFRSSDVEILHVPDLVSVATLKVDTAGHGVYNQVWSPTDYRLEPANALTENGEPWPYTRIRAMVTGGGSYWWPYIFPLSNPDRIQISGVFGWPAMPALVRQAALQLSENLFKLKDVGQGDTEGSAALGVQKIGQSTVLSQLLARYVRSGSKVGV